MGSPGGAALKTLVRRPDCAAANCGRSMPETAPCANPRPQRSPSHCASRRSSARNAVLTVARSTPGS
jgi:hypothetical protein